MLNPAAAYRFLAQRHPGRGSRWLGWRKPLLVAFILGCTMSLIASARLTLRLAGPTVCSTTQDQMHRKRPETARTARELVKRPGRTSTSRANRTAYFFSVFSPLIRAVISAGRSKRPAGISALLFTLSIFIRISTLEIF